MKKRLGLMLLALVLCMAALCVGANAADPDGGYVKEGDNSCDQNCIAHAIVPGYNPGEVYRWHVQSLQWILDQMSSPWNNYSTVNVKFLRDAEMTETLTFSACVTHVIFDLNGKTISGALDSTPVVEVNYGYGPVDEHCITFRNGTIENTAAGGTALKLSNGATTLEDVNVKGDLVLGTQFATSENYTPTFCRSSGGIGSFTKIRPEAGATWKKQLVEMLGEDCFFTDSSGVRLEITTEFSAEKPLTDVRTKACDHKDANGNYTLFKDATTIKYGAPAKRCTVCGNLCPHDKITTDGSNTCTVCGIPIAIEATNLLNGKDIGPWYYTGLDDAVNEILHVHAGRRPVLKLLADVDSACQVEWYKIGDDGLTIDLAGHTLTLTTDDNKSRSDKMKFLNTSEKPGKVIGTVNVCTDSDSGTVTLTIPDTHNDLTIDTLIFKKGGTASLAGGSFGSITIGDDSRANTLADLLASGYYFADTTSGEPAAMYDTDGSAKTELTNVTVKLCSHDTAICGPDGAWTCFCGKKTFVASITKDDTTTYYADMQKAFNAADGGTVKLLANVVDVTVNTEKPFIFDLNGHTVHSLTVNSKFTLKDSSEGTGKIVENLIVNADGLSVGDLLEEGHAFRSCSDNSWPLATVRTVGNVCIQQAPITSVTLDVLNVKDNTVASTTMLYGTTGGVKLSANCNILNQTRPDCKWYEVGGSLITIDNATGMNYSLPDDLAAGTHTYRVTFTSDGYSRSADITITVTPISIVGAEVAVGGLTYTGKAQQPEVTVTLGEKTLTENKDYTLSGAEQTDAGSYQLTVTGKGGYDGKIGNVEWKIEPMKIKGVKDVTSVSKDYDGSADVTLPKANVTFLDDADKEISLPEGAFTITNARFTTRQDGFVYEKSPNAGTGKCISFTLTLTDSNYAFYVFDGEAESVRSRDLSFEPIDDRFTITKASAPARAAELTLYITNGLAKTYEADLAALLSELTKPCEYGNITYSEPDVQVTASGYYSTGTAKVENGKLSLPILENNVDTAGSIGTVTVKVTTQNYKDITLTINLNATNKIIPTGAPTLNKTTLTYGEKLSAITLSGSMKDGDRTVSGTFTWETPDAILNAGTHDNVAWEFTPSDQTTYAEATGTASITVNKATPSGAPKYTAITASGKTLTDAGLTVNESWPKGTVEWELEDTTEVKANTPYKWVFTPTDTANYNTATGSITLYHVSSGGGSDTPTYPVNTPSKTENGNVTVTPRYAERGDTVTIIVKLDEGFKLNDLTVTDKNGNDLQLTDKGSGKYTFTMPVGKVEVKAAFAKEIEISPFDDVPTNAYYYEAVKWAQEKGITDGIGNGLFGSNQPCTRAQIVTFLWRAAGSPEPKTMSGFTDVLTDSYYAKAVAWAVENGITTGTGDGKFSPDATCTRAQSVTFLFRAAEASADGTSSFADVAADAYYAEAVKWAADHGITNGIGNGLFGPDNACTRAQIVTFLWKLYAGK